MTKKDFASKDKRGGVSAAREAMAARYATSVDPSSLPIDQLAHDPTNPREQGDYQTQSISDLAASMRHVGVLEVLGVVRREVYLGRHPGKEFEIGDASWVVAYGNRRLAAAREAGLAEVPVRVQDQLDEQDRTRESRLIENIHHVDLEPLLEAYEVDALVKIHGKKGTVASVLGKSGGWVSQRLALVNLVPQLQSELKDGRLTLESARSLGAIKQVRQLDAWNAGRPYRDPAKAPPAPAPEVMPDAPETYTRTEIPTSNPTRGAQTSAPPQAEFYGVKKHSAAASPDGDSEENEFYGVKKSPSVASAPEQPETAPVPLAPEPLARMLRERFSEAQRAELIRLLQG